MFPCVFTMLVLLDLKEPVIAGLLVPDPLVGADATIAVDALEAALVPTALVAVTVNV